MSVLGNVKQLAISVGVYKPARALHDALMPSVRLRSREVRLFLSQFIRPGDLAFDVGANIGHKTGILLSLGANVVAFEPQPALAREIAARGNKHLTVVNKAVGAVEGTAELYLTSATALASLAPDWHTHGAGAGEKISVPVTTLDKAIETFGLPSFCKIDVEGFEVEVLKGLSQVIPNMSLEYHTDDKGIRQINECLDILSTRSNFMVKLTGQKDEVLSPHWLTIDEFKKSFPECTKGHQWGDVFIRVS